MARQTNRFDEVRRHVAGVDLAGHADHYVCGPRKDDGTHDIEHFGTTTNELLRMAAWMKERKVESAAMESTSVFWIPVYDTLEAAGIECVLVDTRTVKMVPGRKSDIRDCQRLQRLHSCGLLRGAFRRFVVSPAWTCGLAHASGSVETPFGKLSVSWRRGAGLDVAVPPGTQCRAVDEAGREVVLPPGRHHVGTLDRACSLRRR